MIAVDTNVLIYAEDARDTSGRHEQAASLLTQLANNGAVVPVQVLAEFANVCRKMAVALPEMIAKKIGQFSVVFDTPETRASNLQAAITLADKHRLQFFDALIITVAIQAGATVLLSEDMHDGLQIEGLRIINPFNPDNAVEIAALIASPH